MITLKNDMLTAIIESKGAELQSLVHKNGIQYMWSGDASFWGKHSPVLFPIVGSLKDDTYHYNNKAYKLPRHGFARDMVFTARQLHENEAVFTLKHSKKTLEVNVSVKAMPRSPRYTSTQCSRASVLAILYPYLAA